MSAARRRLKSISESTSRSAGSGARPSIAGKRPSRSTRLTQRPSTTWRSPTNTRGSSIRLARRTKRPSPWSRTISRSSRTTSFSRKSMIERAPRKKSRSRRAPALAAMAALAAIAAIGCGTTYFEIPIETPIQAKLDVSAFQRVLIAGFVTGGTDDVDANQETGRLLGSHLRSRSELQVVDPDVLEPTEIARDLEKGGSSDVVENDQDIPVPREVCQAPDASIGKSNGSWSSERANASLTLQSKVKDEKE